MITKKYPELYKIDSKGKTRVWYAERYIDSYRVTSGIYKGALVTSEWRKAEPTNVGRSNQRNGSEQAEFEIDALYKKQRETGYHDDLKHVSTGTRTKTFFEPMLCDRFEKDDAEELLVDFGEVYSQPKLDGIRCVARASGLWTRGGKQIVACKHIEETLAPLFEKAPNLILDGELYNHDFKDEFNELVSMIKKAKPDQVALAKSKMYVQYHMYDAPSFKGGFEQRWKAFSKMDESKYPGLKLVETYTVTAPEALDDLFATYLEDGYEGQIIRLPGVEYQEGKRSKYLLKRKPLYEGGGNEEEFVIRDIMEGKGNWAGAAKAIWFERMGKPFKATLKGDRLTGTTVFKNRAKYIGKKATVVYQNLTPDGIPRFGVVKELVRWDI